MRIEWSLLAIEDREAIFDYIREDSPRSAVRIDDEIESQVETLFASPEIGRPGRVPGTRELVIARTPYVIAYVFEHGSVTILRVLHGAQRWPSRFDFEAAEI